MAKVTSFLNKTQMETAYQALDGAISFASLEIKDNDYENVIEAMETYASQFKTNPIVNTDLIQKALDYLHANITASIVYTDHYDYSRGVEGAEVDYFPETADELLAEMGIQTGVTNPIEVIKDRITELERIIGGDSEYDERSHSRLDEAKHILKLIQ